MSENKKLLKVVAKLREEYVEPEYVAEFNCPHCKAMLYEHDIYDGNDNCTVTYTCHKCTKKFKVKIPKVD